MMREHRLHLICATAILALVLLAAPAAQAAESHPFLTELSGNEAGARTPAGAFEDACGVALDSHGDTYVSDYYHDAVDVFSPSGAYLTQVTKESLGNGPCALAVDAVGRLYVNEWHGDVVRFTPAAYPPGAGTKYGPGETIDTTGTATGLAIDSASGTLYVDDSSHIAAFAAPVEPEAEPTSMIGLSSLGEGYGLAVSAFPATAGDLYVADAEDSTVKVYDPSAPDTEDSIATIGGQGTPQGGFDYLVDSVVAIDPTDGHLFVADNVEHGLSEHPALVLDEFNPAGEYRGQIGRWITHPPSEPGVMISHTLIDAEPSGLAVDPSGRVLVTSENSDASEAGALDRNGKPLEGSVLYTFGPSTGTELAIVPPPSSPEATASAPPPPTAEGSATPQFSSTAGRQRPSGGNTKRCTPKHRAIAPFTDQGGKMRDFNSMLKAKCGMKGKGHQRQPDCSRCPRP